MTDFQSLKVLEDLVKRYPYCQTAQLLFTYNLARQEDLQYHNQLKKAAAYATDRRRLKELLDPSNWKQIPKPVEEKASEEIPPIIESKELPVAEPVVLPESPDEFISLGAVTAAELESLPDLPSANQHENLTINQHSDLSNSDTGSSAAEKPVQPERMTREDLLAIVRKRLAEISSDKLEKNFVEDKVLLKSSGDVEDVKRTKESLIEKFIREEPKITRPKSPFFSASESALRSNIDEEEIVSETLALLYAKQGNNQKAIHIYQKLSLLNQEKSRYFAARIQELASGH